MKRKPVTRNTNSSDLPRRIEEASLNAWPAMRQMLYQGWILRFSRGFTKRSNSIVPLYGPSEDNASNLLQQIRYCENLYAREQLPTVFRLTTLTPHETLRRLLSERGYVQADRTLVLNQPLHSAARTPIPGALSFQLLALEDWLGVYCQLTGMEEPTRSLHRLILNGISGDCAFAVLYQDEQPRACGMAVLEDELVGLFDVFTDPARRGSGYGLHLVNSLLAWAATNGAQRGYLQVVADNEPALRLYTGIGFEDCYEYSYYTVQ